jgi:uncharacterized damage-inducible protein DinB
MIFLPPSEVELSEYYRSYLKYLNGEKDLLQALIRQGELTQNWLSTLNEDVANYSYKPGKWKIKEVIGHLCDTERILCYRALTFARNDKTPLSPFEEDAYILNSNFGIRSLSDIRIEFKTVRAATVSLFSSMTDELANRKGVVNKVEVSPRILLYFILVHERHHTGVINDRYLASI